MTAKPRIAVVSPFLDKRHGTERCVAEQIERLADDFEIHVYSSTIRDVNLSKLIWHRIPGLPGPQLVSYLWFFAANHLRRWWDRKFQNLDFDLVFSPGINCLDADFIAVHIVFVEFYLAVHRELAFRRNPVRMWPRLIHRRMSYHLFMALERRIYTQNELPLAVISHKMEQDLARCFNRRRRLSLLYHGVDLEHMNPARRQSLREETRRRLQLPESAFAILLVGNDWNKKGLPCLIEAVGNLRNPDLWILVCGQDDFFALREHRRHHGLETNMIILPLIREVESYYAAADLYVGPSLEDSFAIPPLEAMACGLPVIVSRQAGVSELLTHGVDGFVLDNATDAGQLAEFIQTIYERPDLRQRLSLNAAATARCYTWQRNAEEMKRFLKECLREKRSKVPNQEPSASTGI
jgi:glycosyltransferase involved in cell wall biosynthesis